MTKSYCSLLALVTLGIATLYFGPIDTAPIRLGASSPIRSQQEADRPHSLGPMGDGALPSSSQRSGIRSASSATTEIPSDSAAGSSGSLNHLPSSEQQSLWKAFSEARREVRPIPDAWSEREENLGYDFYALHPKQNMTTRFGSEGVQMVSSDRTYTAEDAQNPNTAWQAQMRLVSFAGENISQGTAPEKSDQRSSKVEFHHRPGLTEWFENGVEGMEHGYTIAARPGNLSAGEEVSFEVALDGLDVAEWEREDDSEALVFMDGEREVLSYSKLLVVDAEGRELPATMKPSSAGFVLAYHDAQAVYPVTVDPLITNEEAKLNRYDGAAGDNFGSSVAISGDFVVVGADGDADGGGSSGSAYVFMRSGTTWLIQDKLTADDAAANANFGNAIGISGDSVVVGANGDAEGGAFSGSAYVFVRSGNSWTQQTKLTADDAAAYDEFGLSVAISGDSVVVGAYKDDDGGGGSGSAYVFVRSGSIWTQQDKLTASDAAADDLFGRSVSISDNSVVVGAYLDDDAGGGSGSAYVFVRSGTNWTQQAKLTAADATAGDIFGRSVAISDDSVVIGANGDDDEGSDSGSAYVFVRSGTNWMQQAKLIATDAAAGDFFGQSVAISGDSVVVGAYFDDDGGESSGSAYVFVRSGANWVQQDKLIAGDDAADDRFGWFVAISGNSVVVGAHLDDDGDTDSGSAYVFVRSGTVWTQQKKLIAGDAAAEDYFGISVAVSGDTAVIGAQYDDDGGSGSGSAYIFVRVGTSWSQQAKLTAGDAAGGDRFGTSVAVSGDTAVIGASGDDDGAGSSGSAYIFVRVGTNWSQQAKLTASNPGAGDSFGESVAVSGDTAVIGSPWDDDGGSASGSAYIFVRVGTSWSQQAKLKASNPEAEDFFGVSVAVSGDTAVIGAEGDDDGGSGSGSAYVFVRVGTSWSQQAKLKASNPEADDYFGHSVSVSGDTAVIGAYGDDDGGSASGSAYAFVRAGTTWSQQAKLRDGDAAVNDLFGVSVAVSGDTAVIGSPWDDDGVIDSGSAYIFVRSGTSWSQQAKLTAGDAAADDRFGYSVAVSGDTAVIGAYLDDDGVIDSGSVYVFRLAEDGGRALLISDHLGLEVPNGGALSPLKGQQTGSSTSYPLHLSNAGTLALDIQSVSLGGADAAEFSLMVPDISSSTDLAQGESMELTLTFSPTGSTRLRNATVFITSNDTDTPAQSFTVSGLGLSRTADADLDGMNDWAEFSLSSFGFDWNTPQPDEVSNFNSLLTTAGYFDAAEFAEVNASVALVEVDTATQTADFVIALEESLDLETFNPITINPARLSVDGDGNIRYQVDAPPGKKFFSAGFKP